MGTACGGGAWAGIPARLLAGGVAGLGTAVSTDVEQNTFLSP